MAWTATLISVTPQPNNPGNVQVEVQFVNGSESFTERTFSNTLTPAELKVWCKKQVDNYAARQVAQTNLLQFLNQSIQLEAEPDPTPEEAALATFQMRWLRLMQLKRLASTAPAVVTMVNNLQGQVEAYLLANPTAIDKVF